MANFHLCQSTYCSPLSSEIFLLLIWSQDFKDTCPSLFKINFCKYWKGWKGEISHPCQSICHWKIFLIFRGQHSCHSLLLKRTLWKNCKCWKKLKTGPRSLFPAKSWGWGSDQGKRGGSSISLLIFQDQRKIHIFSAFEL